MSEPPMCILFPLAGHIYFCVWCYIPTTATSAAEAQQRYKQGLALWTELVNTKWYTYKYPFSTELLEMVKWLQNLRKADSLMSHVFFRPALTTGKQKKKISRYLHYSAWFSATQFQCLQNFWVPISCVQHLTFPKRRLKNATFLHY